MLEKVAPEKVSTIILKSTCFTEYKKDKVITFKFVNVNLKWNTQSSNDIWYTVFGYLFYNV